MNTQNTLLLRDTLKQHYDEYAAIAKEFGLNKRDKRIPRTRRPVFALTKNPPMTIWGDFTRIFGRYLPDNVTNEYVTNVWIKYDPKTRTMTDTPYFDRCPPFSLNHVITTEECAEFVMDEDYANVLANMLALLAEKYTSVLFILDLTDNTLLISTSEIQNTMFANLTSVSEKLRTLTGARNRLFATPIKTVREILAYMKDVGQIKVTFALANSHIEREHVAHGFSPIYGSATFRSAEKIAITAPILITEKSSPYKIAEMHVQKAV